MKNVYTIILMFALTSLIGQREYIGAGEIEGVTVNTSHDFNEAKGINTINGAGLDADRMEAARFLYQAGFGASMSSINSLAIHKNFDLWIDQQFDLSPTYVLPKLTEINEETFRSHIERGESPDDYFGPWMMHFSYAWWDNLYKSPDQLRYKVAHALSQILVISFNSDLNNHGEAMAAYYDLLLKRSFDNYKTLLLDITMNPSMGYYLSHLNNPKTNESKNQHPDENYAREIMQLFTIGLYELNLDGTRKLDESGNPIPTYDNGDIKELAKVFTGLMGGDLSYKIKNEYPNARIEFGADLYAIDRTVPMQMFESQHEKGSKTIVGDFVIPNGQSGLEDIRMAVDHLFNHPNVAPFVSKQLIQRMVKSNPTPQYVERVAKVFEDNGRGVRGDMKSVIKAILLDQEARSCEFLLDPHQGQLREPVLRHTHVMFALPTDSPTGNYWKDPLSLYESTKQSPQTSPTVFNFYKPDYQPIGAIYDQNLVAPEFQIFDSETAIGYVNQVLEWSFYEYLMYSWEPNDNVVDIIFNDLEEMSSDGEALINHLDVLFTYGQMSPATRGVIRRAIDQLPPTQYAKERAQLALYLTLISPDYTIIK